MADPFVGEIRVFGGSFTPVNWAFCNGQVLAIADYPTLFSILRNHYGGDGSATFALPDLNGSMAIGAGTGPGLTPRAVGDTGGEDAVTLTAEQMPQHVHAWMVASVPGVLSDPSNAVFGAGAYAPRGKIRDMHPDAMLEAGGGQPHDNRQPYLKLSFIIALHGIIPPRPS
jgi:microcystin-dependent protein